MVYDITESISPESGVDRHNIHADFLGTKKGIQESRGIPHEDSDPFSFAASDLQKKMCDPVRIFIHLPVCYFFIPKKEKCFVRHLFCSFLQEFGP